MHPWHGIDPAYALSGLLVGVLVGLTGTGGGSLMTPLLLFFGIHPATAVGTDLHEIADHGLHAREINADPIEQAALLGVEGRGRRAVRTEQARQS